MKDNPLPELSILRIIVKNQQFVPHKQSILYHIPDTKACIARKRVEGHFFWSALCYMLLIAIKLTYAL